MAKHSMWKNSGIDNSEHLHFKKQVKLNKNEKLKESVLVFQQQSP